jgi:hypothetical protein
MMVAVFCTVTACEQKPQTKPPTKSASPFLPPVNTGVPSAQAFLTPLARVDQISRHWKNGFTPMILETSHFARSRQHLFALMQLLEDRTGQKFGTNVDHWWQWVWDNQFEPHPDYAQFKSRLYERLDPRFAAYFDNDRPVTIRLDEIRWGGVKRDGIPPLDKPKMISGQTANYLEDDNIVFGVEINDDARAYPKRILAHHEMFKDTIGDVSVCGVYCTLCGSMIVYKTQHNGQHHELGTSGFLYRSNKLMYDHATESLWSTTRGEPVVGPLVGQGIKLEPLYVVTTTWGHWRKLHPQTTVLSLDTGHKRDYGEGVAYRDYFATDQLMFVVPKLDTRLFNKDQVLALRFADADKIPIAIAADFLAKRPVYQNQLGDQHYVVLTDASGANRVYDAKEHTFTSYDRDVTVVDKTGDQWTVHEAKLQRSDGKQLKRLPAHRQFWFGWFAAHPNTLLIGHEKTVR